METVMAGENDPSTQGPIGNITDEGGLIELFDHFSSLMLPVLHWVELDSNVVICEGPLKGKRTTYQITIQNLIKTT